MFMHALHTVHCIATMKSERESDLQRVADEDI